MLHICMGEWHRQCELRGLTPELTAMPTTPRPQLSRQIAAFVLGQLAQQSTELDSSAVCDAFFAQFQPTEQLTAQTHKGQAFTRDPHAMEMPFSPGVAANTVAINSIKTVARCGSRRSAE